MGVLLKKENPPRWAGLLSEVVGLGLGYSSPSPRPFVVITLPSGAVFKRGNERAAAAGGASPSLGNEASSLGAGL
jgi:hypothetical protein